jgi:3-deoxy-D-manno-octulosonic-acid transferase
VALARTSGLGALAYGGLITALFRLHAALSPLLRGDEGGLGWYRRRRHPALPLAATGPRVWIHAASAGEARVAELLRAALLVRRPELDIVLSATTYSGIARAGAIAGEAQSFVMPVDDPAEQERLFAGLRPSLLVLCESEFWPAQFAAAEAAGVPVVVVNATMSERSYHLHRRLPWVARRTVVRAARVYAQDEAIVRRFVGLGLPEERVEVCGNLKLAGKMPVRTLRDADAPMVTFGNVHAAELAALAPAVAELRRRRPDLRIALVPRFPGKADLSALRRVFGPGLRIVTSEQDAGDGERLVWVNAMGVLAPLYARSDIGVVCGTFAPVGGHNLAEPLAMGAASLYGPHVERQAAMHRTLMDLAAATQVADAAALPGAIDVLLAGAEGRRQMLARYGTAVEAANQRLEGIAAALLRTVDMRLPGNLGMPGPRGSTGSP